jgi:hypothetical protein
MVKLTGLWKNTDKEGKIYLTGQFNPAAAMVVLPNTFKKKDNEPDYYLYVKPVEKKAKDEKQAGQTL